jgi:aminoglycoside phosphotransferase (APT) family kinase protein
MHDRIHEDEPDTSESVVRTLLAAECPQWAGLPLTYLKTSGTDNAMWRIQLDKEPDVIVRLPRRPGAAEGVTQEIAVLQQLESMNPGLQYQTPRVRHVGQPHQRFRSQWSVLEWIDGTDAWTNRVSLAADRRFQLAADLAGSVLAISALDTAVVHQRSAGSRGGPIAPILDRLNTWLNDPQWNAAGLLDIAAIKRLADEAWEVADESVAEGFVHGDLIPGNILISNSCLAAIIDWGGAGWGDTAEDLAPAWSVFDAVERSVFREAVGASDAAWIRGRTFELEHAVGGVLYYSPKRHPLGNVMQRTLARLLEKDGIS